MPRLRTYSSVPAATMGAAFRDLQDAYRGRGLRLVFDEPSRRYVAHRRKGGALVSSFDSVTQAQAWLGSHT